MVRHRSFIGLCAALMAHYGSGCSPIGYDEGNGERAVEDGCPPGEECSDVAPDGLLFRGASLTGYYTYGVAATAVGGTQEILATKPDDTEMDIAYAADDDGGEFVRIIDDEAANVTVQGVAAGANYLRMLDEKNGLLLDRYELHAAAVTNVKLVSGDYESIPEDTELVWSPGSHRIGVALFGDVLRGGAMMRERLVDTSMTIDFDGRAQLTWDSVMFSAVTTGRHPLVATTADGVAHELEVEVVNTADAVEPNPETALTAEVGWYKSICFQAFNEGRFVVGLPWRFELGGRPITGNGNCVGWTVEGRPGTTLTLRATAGGASTSVEVQLVRAPSKTAVVSDATKPALGSRAALATH